MTDADVKLLNQKVDEHKQRLDGVGKQIAEILVMLKEHGADIDAIRNELCALAKTGKTP
jgi:hypothetical protein